VDKIKLSASQKKKKKSPNGNRLVFLVVEPYFVGELRRSIFELAGRRMRSGEYNIGMQAIDQTRIKRGHHARSRDKIYL
jgi:hypothetical protein